MVTLLVYGGYRAYRSATSTTGETRYLLHTVERTTLVSTITGSGQVAVSSQIELKPKASGEIVYIGVRDGQVVGMGATIAQLDTTDAKKEVRDAEVNLESAKLALEKLRKPAEQLSITQAEHALVRARESKKKAEDDMLKAYEDGFNNVANAFLDLPVIMTGLQDIFYSTTNTINPGQANGDFYTSTIRIYDDQAETYQKDVNEKYKKARADYEATFANYKSTSRFSKTPVIDTLIRDTYTASRNVAEAIKSANNLIQLYKDNLADHNIKPAAAADTHVALLTSYTSKTNGHLASLLGNINTIKTSNDTIGNADRSIRESEESLTKIMADPDVLDIKSAELTITQRENSLLDAKQRLADYFVLAPFTGTVAKVHIKRGDSVSSGTAVATLVTREQLAEISLNEVDAAKVSLGQKATLTFDAIEGLQIGGTVSGIDTLGTVSQGVVTYIVKVSFDNQDSRVKPGMSVTASIVTARKSNVLTVPNSAVKSRGNRSYVETIVEAAATSTRASSTRMLGVRSLTPPREQTVVIGIASETSTEVTSGLKEGDRIVVRTFAPTATAATQPAPSLFGGGAPRTAGGGTVRTQR